MSTTVCTQCSYYHWEHICLSNIEKQEYEFVFATPTRVYEIQLKDGVQTINMETQWVSNPVKKSYRLPQINQKLNELIYQFVQNGQFCYKDKRNFLRIEGICASVAWKSDHNRYSWDLVWPEVQERMKESYNELNLYLFQITPQWHQYPESFPFMSTNIPPHVSPK